MRTRIYIDDYNLYYGCLKGTPYKWLDLVKLFEHYILPRSGTPLSVLHDRDGIKYFTAEINDKAASDPDSLKDQRSYHQALYLHSVAPSKQLRTIKGNYAVDQVRFPKVEEMENGKEKDPKDSQRVKVWKLEEKQSDVNVALEAVYDVVTDESIEQVVFVTNDTDIVPALKKIREHNQKNVRSPVTIGLVIPAKNRQPNGSLVELADWTVSNIKDDELQGAQLPCRVPGRRGAALKPTSWFQYSQQVAEILEILSAPDVLKSPARSWSWLSKPVPKVDGLPNLINPPAELLDCKQGVNDVLQHAKAFAEYKKTL